MKRLLLFVCTAISTSLLAVTPTPTPSAGSTDALKMDLRNGQIVNALQSVFRQTVGLTSTAKSNAGITKDIWVSVRTDGLTGSGTKGDPTNVATAGALDTVLNGLTGVSVVHMIPNSSTTPYLVLAKGNGNTWAATSVKIIGESGGSAYIKLANSQYASGTSGTVLGDPYTFIDSFSCENVTIDCNNANQGLVTNAGTGVISAMGVYANNVRYENVRVIGGYASGSEVSLIGGRFKIYQSSQSNPARGLFRNVSCEGSIGTVSHIAYFPGDSSGSTVDYPFTFAVTVVDSCQVVADGNSINAFAVGGSIGHLTNCYADNVGNAVGGDTFLVGDVTVDNCRFNRVRQYGFQYYGNNAGQYKRLSVRDTRISCIGESTAMGWILSPDIISVVFERCIIEHGTGTLSDGGEIYLGNFGATPNVTIKDCIFPAGAWGGVLPLSTSGSIRYINNKSSDGAPATINSNVLALPISERNLSATATVGNTMYAYVGKLAAGNGVTVECDYNVEGPTLLGTGGKHFLQWANAINYKVSGAGSGASLFYYQVIDGTHGYLWLAYPSVPSTNTFAARVRTTGNIGYIASTPAFSGATQLGIPTIAAGAGAGTSPTIAISGTDSTGLITLTTGSTPSTSATVCTVTYGGGAYGASPHVIISPHNAATAALAVGAQPFGGGETSSVFTLTSGSSALTAATAYAWTYKVTQ